MAPRSKIKEKLDKGGKVSPLEPPKAKKKEPTAKKKVDKAPSKKIKGKPDAKAPAKRVVKEAAKKVAKATAKKVVVPPVSPNLFRTMIGFGARAIAPVALAVTGTSLAAPVFRHLFPKKDPATISEKTKRMQDLMSKTIGSRKGAGTEIMAGIPLGLQGDKAKKAASPSYAPDPVPRPLTKKKESTLGKTKPRLFKDTEGIPNMDVDIVGTLSRYPGALDKTTKQPKPEVEKKITESIGKVLSPTEIHSKITSKGDSRPAAQKAPQNSMRKAQTDTSMGVYGWNNLTKSFGYLGTEKEVGKHGASTYFTKGFKRGSRVEGYKKKKSA